MTPDKADIFFAGFCLGVLLTIGIVSIGYAIGITFDNWHVLFDWVVW